MTISLNDNDKDKDNKKDNEKYNDNQFEGRARELQNKHFLTGKHLIFRNFGPLQKVAHQEVGHCPDGVDQDCKVVACVLLLLLWIIGNLATNFPLKFLCRRQNLEQKLLGESEAGEVLEAGDGDDEQQGLVHLRLTHWDPQLLFRRFKHLANHTLF